MDWRVITVVLFFAIIEVYWLMKGNSGLADEQAQSFYNNEIHNLKNQILTLTDNNKALKTSISGLTDSNAALTESNTALTNSNTALTDSNTALTESNTKLSTTNNELKTENSKLIAQLSQPGRGTPPTTTTAAPAATSDPNPRQAFENIYTNQIWGGLHDTRYGNGSGEGSSIPNTEGTRRIIKEVVKKYKLYRMMDAPCGAMVWMHLVVDELNNELEEGFQYMGVDVVRNVIRRNRVTFKEKPNMKFQLCDISYCNLPYGYDLIFTRDALQHLNHKLIFGYLQNIRESDAKYFMAGTYLNNGFNAPISTGSYFSIDLLQPPFSLPPTIGNFSEGKFPTFPEKWLLLWKVEDLRTKWNPPPEYADLR